MNEITLDELVFFDNNQLAFELYDVLRKRIFDLFPDTDIQIRKTQINFKSKHIYACVSFLRVLKKSEMPNPYIVLTLGFPWLSSSELPAQAGVFDNSKDMNFYRIYEKVSHKALTSASECV